MKMIRRPALLLPLFAALVFTPFFGSAQSSSITLPPGTPFPVQIDDHLPMRVGTVIKARLPYPVYAGETLLIPENTILVGSIVALRPDRSRRIHARLNIDFTPFHIPVVRFTKVVLADGRTLPLVSGDATDGAPIFRLVAPPPRKGGLVRQQYDVVVSGLKDRLHVVTGPDKRDRLEQLLYSQLPYHPERIAKGTAWTVESTEPLAIERQALPLPSPSPPTVETAAATDAPPTWMVQAYLNDELDSKTTKAGQAIKATVAEPIYNADHTVAVPQGAILIGNVTKAKTAQRFGRTGALSFSFRQLMLPGGEAESVQTSLAGADSATSANLAMTSEGEVKPKPQDRIAVPLLLIALAARPLDRDGGDGMLGKDAVASNSLGLIGFVVGIAARQPNIAAGLATMARRSRCTTGGSQRAKRYDLRGTHALCCRLRGGVRRRSSPLRRRPTSGSESTGLLPRSGLSQRFERL